MSQVIETRSLSKTIRRNRAADGVSLSVPRGSVYALVGRCGSGKTAVARLILGLIRPTSGEARLFGKDVTLEGPRLRERVGYVPDGAAFHEGLTAWENLEFQRRLRGVRNKTLADEALALLGLSDVRDVGASKIGGDGRQRLSIARALMFEPEVLVLDEPSQGLDAVSVRELRRLLRDAVESRGATVFICDQDLSLAEELATRVGVLHEGRLLEEMDRKDISRHARDHVDLSVSDASRAAWILEERLGVDEYVVLREGELRVFTGQDRSAEINRCLVESGIDVRRLVFERASLEDIFVDVTGSDGEVEHE